MAREVVRRARGSERVQAAFADVFLGEVMSTGFRIADVGLERIGDVALRERLRTVLVAGATGAVIGGAVGALAGPTGVPVGAGLGAGLGVAAAVVILAIFRDGAAATVPATAPVERGDARAPVAA